MPQWKTIKENGFERDVMTETTDEAAQRKRNAAAASFDYAGVLKRLDAIEAALTKLTAGKP